jgi:hypothetical protein
MLIPSRTSQHRHAEIRNGVRHLCGKFPDEHFHKTDVEHA